MEQKTFYLDTKTLQNSKEEANRIGLLFDIKVI